MTRTLLGAILLFATAAAFAQTDVVIERIDVTTTRARPAIIVSETRLVAGRSYSAAQLDQAIYRVRRLPFVAGAEYTLEPGSTPDKRVMRIRVIDEPMFHYNLDIQTLAIRGGYATTTAGLGLRFFPGPSGSLDLSLGGIGFTSGGGNGNGHFGDVAVQYTQYGLFGTSAYAGVGLVTRINPRKRMVDPLFLAGIPLTQTQTLRTTYSKTGDDHDNSSLLAAEWMYETTDDPIFTRRGLDVVAGPQRQTFHFVADFNPGTPFAFHIDDRGTATGFSAAIEKYWPLAKQSAYWVRANDIALHETGTNNGKAKISSNSHRGDLIFGVAHNFDAGREIAENYHHWRLEAGAGYHLERYVQGTYTDDRRTGAEVFAGVAYRSRFGIFRLGVSFVGNND